MGLILVGTKKFQGKGGRSATIINGQGVYEEPLSTS